MNRNWNGLFLNSSPRNLVSEVLLKGALQEHRLEDAVREAIRHYCGGGNGLGTLRWEATDPISGESSTVNDRLAELFQREQERTFPDGEKPIPSASLVRVGPEVNALILSIPLPAESPIRSAALVDKIGAAYALANPGERAAFELRESPAARHTMNPGAEPRGEDSVVLPEESAPAGPFLERSLSFTMDTALVAELDACAAAHGAPAANLLIAAWQTLIYRLTSTSRFSLDVHSEAPVAIPARFEDDPAFSQVLDRVRHAAPTEHASGDQQPPARLAFEYAELPPAQQHGGVIFHLVRQSSCTFPYALKLSAQRSETGLTLTIGYDGSRLGQDTVERWLEHFETLLAKAVESPETAVSQLPLLTDNARRQLLEDWNQTEVDFPRHSCVHELFEAQASRAPDRLAVRCGEEVLTYSELNENANQLADYLRGLGVSAGSLVGLCVDRSVRMITGLMAILKAGGAYLPLDPNNPDLRLEQQLASAVALVTESDLSHRAPGFTGPRVSLDTDAYKWAESSKVNPGPSTDPEKPVYVIFTSGSSGTPKGVVVRHRNLVHYTNFIQRRLELDKHPAGWHFAMVSTLSADLGNTSIFPALASGGCVHLISEDMARSSMSFATYSRQYPIDVLKIVPSHLEALLDSSDGTAVLPRNYLILGGEALSMRLVRRIRDLGATCEIGNHYGPTETTVESVVFRLSDAGDSIAPEQSVPIGKPVDNTRIYILDANLQPAPIGVVGELYVAGEGVSAGYLNQPELTAERFLADPFAGKGMMYRTGDLCRYLPSGDVDFLGRADDQVKIHGYRVELGEIEAVLGKHPAVKQAVVVPNSDHAGGKRLVAYVVGPLTTEALSSHLKNHLPEYMIPSLIIPLEKLPLNANGKVDRRSLPDPDQYLSQLHAYAAPQTETEGVVAAIWCEVLGRDRIGLDENFFEIGGHSLAGIQVMSRILNHFHVKLDIGTIFDSPTIGELAPAIDMAIESGAATSPVAQIVAVPREQYRVARS